MIFTHHGLRIELNDDWWTEAEMVGFVATTIAYRFTPNSLKVQEISEVCIEDIGPVHRGPGVGIFNDSEEGTARERVVRILRGFRSGDAIPPVAIVEGRPPYPFRYKLSHGVHRFYCSLAAGFTHVPAVSGFDWEALDR